MAALKDEALKSSSQVGKGEMDGRRLRKNAKRPWVLGTSGDFDLWFLVIFFSDF